MARAGDVIENPVSGERITWLQTAAETSGELLQWEHALRPGARVPFDHIHQRQQERFDIISGTARVRLGSEERDLGAGESIVIPPGTAHGLRNDTNDELRVRVELRPAMQTEAFFEAVFGLARDGKVDRRGLPNALRVAVIARSLGQRDYAPAIPIVVQQAAFILLASLGRQVGYKTPNSGDR